eukprot:4132576-Ditylum_brightwellii.AAC.1
MENNLIFPMVMPTNNQGNGDSLCTPFQREFCWVQNLHKRDPDLTSPSDKRIMMYICRANLDIFWARARSTVNSVLTGMRKGMQLSHNLGINTNYPAWGQWPVSD